MDGLVKRLERKPREEKETITCITVPGIGSKSLPEWTQHYAFSNDRLREMPNQDKRQKHLRQCEKDKAAFP